MLPLGHAALGYLLSAVAVRVSGKRVPLRYAIVPLAVGTQFPDLVDKPLAYLGVLAYGRSLTHSIFALVLVIALVWTTARHLNSRLQSAWRTQLCRWGPVAFAIGYVSHILGDAHEAVLAGNFYETRFLLYPLSTLPETPADDIAPWIRMVRIYQEMGTHPQLELILVALVVFSGARIQDYRNTRPTEETDVAP
jgi:membrane-bound metal-dependent hydrolase YbcI (DUF457 family)